jgi:hypothetical protein
MCVCVWVGGCVCVRAQKVGDIGAVDLNEAVHANR